MKIRHILLGILFCFAHLAQAQEPIILDAMTDAQSTAAGEANWVLGSNIIGGEREISNLDNIFQIEIENGLFSGTAQAFTSVRIVYDGQDEDSGSIDYLGLDSLDLSGMDVFRISAVQSLSSAVLIDIAVFSDEANASGVSRGPFPQQGTHDLFVPFSDFEVLSGDGVDWSRVGAIAISFLGQFGQVRLLMKEIAFEIAFIPVELSAFNALADGSKVHLTWQTESERIHTFEIDGSLLSSGTYLYRVQGERFSETKRIVVAK